MYDKNKLYKNISFIIIAVAILFNSIQIIQDYIVKFELNGIIASIYPRFCNFAHVALGTTIFIVLKSFFSKMFKDKYPNSVIKFCSYSDKYSYDIYLVHQFVILGPFSLMNITNMTGINIILILLIVSIGAIFTNYISSYIRNKIKLKA